MFHCTQILFSFIFLAGTRQRVNADSDSIPVIFNGYDIIDVQNYGCWCRFSPNSTRHGEPVDAMDKICHQYFQNIDCLMNADKMISTEDDVYAVEYNVINNFAIMSHDEIPQLCEDDNPGAPQLNITVCILHSTFTFDMFMQYFSAEPINPMLKDDNGFDFADRCHASELTLQNSVIQQSEDNNTAGQQSAEAEDNVVVNGGNNNSTQNNTTTSAPVIEKTCCGAYPKRFPYKKEHGRGCCGLKTYNLDMYECCDKDSSSIKQVC